MTSYVFYCPYSLYKACHHFVFVGNGLDLGLVRAGKEMVDLWITCYKLLTTIYSGVKIGILYLVVCS